MVTQTESDSQIAESYRAILTTIKHVAFDHGKKVVLVTSPMPGEGKSTIAMNLAILSAQAGHRVLLMDGDLRRPNLHFYMDMPNRSGLSTILSGFTEPEQACTESRSVDRLDLLPAGPIQSRPAELIGSSRMERLIEHCTARYDILFIDSPPLLMVTDAMLLASVSDSIILVTRAGMTTKQHIARAHAMMEPFRDKVVGMIFNGAD